MSKTLANLERRLAKIQAEMASSDHFSNYNYALADAYDAIDLKIAAAATKATRKIVRVNDRWNPVGCDLLFDGRVISAQDEMGDYCSQWVLRENGKIIGKFDYLTQGYAALRAGRI